MKSPYTPIGKVIKIGNPETELQDDIIVIVATLIIISLVVIVLSCFK